MDPNSEIMTPAPFKVRIRIIAKRDSMQSTTEKQTSAQNKSTETEPIHALKV